MNSLKIVLLADIHFGYSIGEKHAELLVKKINAEYPDLICIAGDIFDNEYEGIKDPQKNSGHSPFAEIQIRSLCLLGQP